MKGQRPKRENLIQKVIRLNRQVDFQVTRPRERKRTKTRRKIRILPPVQISPHLIMTVANRQTM